MSRLSNAWNELRGVSEYHGTQDNFIEKEIPNIISGNLPFNLDKADQISTVYTCAKIYSDSVSNLPINIIKPEENGAYLVDKKDYRYPILHFQPNGYTTTNKFFATLEYMRQLHGNSYAKINRDAAGRVKSMTLLSSTGCIGTKVVRGQLYYMFKNTNDKNAPISTYNSENILHFTNVTKDGITGVSALTALRMNMGINFEALQTIKKMYDRELRTGKALKYDRNVPNKKAQKEGVEQFLKDFGGSQNAGKLLTLPDGGDLIDLQLSIHDAEFINTIGFTKTEIATAMMVPLHRVGILEASKFNSVEAMGQEFLNQGLGSALKVYRSELEFKLLSLEERMAGVSIEFNTKAMMAIDFKTRIEGYKSLIQQGIISPNYAANMENFPQNPNGDKYWMPANFLFMGDRSNANDTTTPNINKTKGV